VEGTKSRPSSEPTVEMPLEQGASVGRDQRRSGDLTLLGREVTRQRTNSFELDISWHAHFSVVGTGVDPVTSRFSGARSTN
jgi:hypothetical protein